jgi:hypothetical protein
MIIYECILPILAIGSSKLDCSVDGRAMWKEKRPSCIRVQFVLGKGTRNVYNIDCSCSFIALYNTLT